MTEKKNGHGAEITLLHVSLQEKRSSSKILFESSSLKYCLNVNISSVPGQSSHTATQSSSNIGDYFG